MYVVFGLLRHTGRPQQESVTGGVTKCDQFFLALRRHIRNQHNRDRAGEQIKHAEQIIQRIRWTSPITNFSACCFGQRRSTIDLSEFQQGTNTPISIEDPLLSSRPKSTARHSS
jgi:hypothetical protein